jgi:hypothetical protein
VLQANIFRIGINSGQQQQQQRQRYSHREVRYPLSLVWQRSAIYLFNAWYSMRQFDVLHMIILLLQGLAFSKPLYPYQFQE